MIIGVFGESGAGKTTSLKNLDPKTTFIIDCDKKGMNWKNWKKDYSFEKHNYMSTNMYTTVYELIKKINTQDNLKHIKTVVIDTINGIMVSEEMRILAQQGGDKRSQWSDLANHVWGILEYCHDIREDLNVIIIAHSETISDENGIVKTRIKTNGRKLEKIVLESMLNVLVWAVREDGKYKFKLSADNCTAKVPLGAFNTDEIDLSLIHI